MTVDRSTRGRFWPSSLHWVDTSHCMNLQNCRCSGDTLENCSGFFPSLLFYCLSFIFLSFCKQIAYDEDEFWSSPTVVFSFVQNLGYLTYPASFTNIHCYMYRPPRRFVERVKSLTVIFLCYVG